MGAALRHSHAKYGVCFILNMVKLSLQGGRDHGPCKGQFHTVADAIAATRPARVNQPHFYIMLFKLFSQHGSIATRMQGKEGCAEASAESRFRFCDTSLRSGHLS